MRILHLIGASHTTEAEIGQILAQSQLTETVVMAPDRAAPAERLLQEAVPVIWMKPGQRTAHIANAMEVLQPDLVHLHGVLDSEATLPLRVFSNRPLVLELNAADSDGAGGLRHELRGIRLDWRGGQAVSGLCPSDLVASAEIARAALPRTLLDVTMFNPVQVAAPWFLNQYRRVLLAGQAGARSQTLPGFA